jgi:hypothetical protein
MIDNSLARMIDETLQKSLEIDGFRLRKMLEVPVNQAHLEERRPLPSIASNPRNFVRDLFTIGCLKAFA